jgi:predicted unusual protein kinase regulating ubiquinone biosynthesis (AarF/ABC1/UbiB family)
MQARFQEVKRLLDSLHDAGYRHGDCHFSNIMQNRERKLVLIDLALSGPLGSEVPEEFQRCLVRGSRYTADIDREMIKRCGNLGR